MDFRENFSKKVNKGDFLIEKFVIEFNPPYSNSQTENMNLDENNNARVTVTEDELINVRLVKGVKYCLCLVIAFKALEYGLKFFDVAQSPPELDMTGDILSFINYSESEK